MRQHPGVFIMTGFMGIEKLPKTYCPIKNTIVDALANSRLSAYESAVVWAVIRRTYGWTKKDGTRKTEDWIALSQFEEATGIAQSHISRTIKLLILRRILTKRGKFLGINKRVEEWINLGHKEIQGQNLPKEVMKLTKRGKKNLPKGVTTKEKKESITKEINTTEQAPDSVENPVDKVKDNPEVKAALDAVLKAGFNIYAMIFKAKVMIKQPKDWRFPEEVVLRVCKAYHQEKDRIREPWPWFLSVLKRETELWHAEQNVKESQAFKQQGPLSLAQILAKAAGGKCTT